MTSDRENAPLTRIQRVYGQFMLLDLNEDLTALRDFAFGKPRQRGLRPIPDWAWHLTPQVEGDDPRSRLRRWANVFSDELDVVQAARNNVAHVLEIEDADLTSAVRIAARLLMYARVSVYPDNYEKDIAFQDKRIKEGLDYPASVPLPG